MAGGVCECRFLLSEVVRSVVVSICGRACKFLGLSFLLRRSLCGRPSRHWSAVDRNTKSTLSSLNNERGTLSQLSNGTGLLDCTDPYNVTIRDYIGLHTIMVAAITYYAV